MICCGSSVLLLASTPINHINRINRKFRMSSFCFRTHFCACDIYILKHRAGKHCQPDLYDDIFLYYECQIIIFNDLLKFMFEVFAIMMAHSILLLLFQFSCIYLFDGIFLLAF